MELQTLINDVVDKMMQLNSTDINHQLRMFPCDQDKKAYTTFLVKYITLWTTVIDDTSVKKEEVLEILRLMSSLFKCSIKYSFPDGETIEQGKYKDKMIVINHTVIVTPIPSTFNTMPYTNDDNVDIPEDQYNQIIDYLQDLNNPSDKNDINKYLEGFGKELAEETKPTHPGKNLKLITSPKRELTLPLPSNKDEIPDILKTRGSKIVKCKRGKTKKSLKMFVDENEVCNDKTSLKKKLSEFQYVLWSISEAIDHCSACLDNSLKIFHGFTCNIHDDL